MESLFEQKLQAYPQHERAVGVPAGDVAGALALFVIASYEAYRDADVDTRSYKRIVGQLRRVLQNRFEFARGSARYKREIYEQMAIVGMFLSGRRAEARKSGDATETRKVRDEAAQCISAWLKIEPDRLRISRAGLSLAIPGGGLVDGTSMPPAPGGVCSSQP
jgi:hypothetical protein